MKHNKRKIGLGTVQFGTSYGISNTHGKTSPNEVTKILDLAKKNGIKILDSASAYGNAEEVLGKNDLDEFQVISKFMPPQDENLRVQLKNSLKSLRVKQLYAYLAHRPRELMKNPNQWEEMLQLKEEGRIQKIGFSLNKPEELEELLSKDLVPDIVQAPFNYFDNRFEKSFLLLQSMGCEVHTRSTFLQGLFFMKPDVLSPYFNEIKDDLRELQLLQEDLSVSLLNFVLDKSFINKVIIGVESSNQLRQNLEGLKNVRDLPALNNAVPKHILSPSLWKNK